MDMGKRAVLYARAAADPSHSTSAQIDACRALSQQKGYTITGKFVDDGSPSPQYRPAFDELRDLVAKGGADVVVCYTFDRLIRSPQDLHEVLKDFREGQATVECVHWDRRAD